MNHVTQDTPSSPGFKAEALRGIVDLHDVERIEAGGWPADLPASTYEMIRRTAQAHPDAPALSFFLRAADQRTPETWTYAQWFERITRAANLFHALGANREKVIAFVLPNLPETHWVIWGGEAAGIVMAINPLLEPPAIADLINASGASILVTLGPFPGTELWPKVQGILTQLLRVEHLVLVDPAERVQGRLKRFGAGLMRHREIRRLHGGEGVRGAVPRRIGIHDFEHALRAQPGSGLVSGRRIEASDYASYFCTGGTTGSPRIAVRTHGNEVTNAWSTGQVLADVGLGTNLFCGLPLFHVNAVMVTGLLPFSKGAHVVLGTPQGYRGEGVVAKFWEIVEHHRIHFFSGVPTLYSGLLQVPVDGRDVSSLRYGLCGAAPMPVEVFRAFEERTGLAILEGYGLTEGGCVSSVNPPLGERRLGSIGLRLPGQRMKVAALDERGAYLRDCDTDETGVILIAGPNVFAGYLLPDQNRGVWVEAGDGERWLNTGDLGRRDAEGYFWLTGRRKELIIRGGHNIDPMLIEAPLHRHPAVLLAAAVGQPDAHAGEVPVAYVQLRPGADTDEATLLNFLREEISERAALPRRVRIVEQLPLTPVGKLFKPALKQREIQAALTDALTEAGIGVRALHVAMEPDGRYVVRAELEPEALRETAYRVLGCYPFAFTLE